MKHFTIAQIILFPIRAFREELRTNPLSRLTWGIEPRSHKRRLIAGVALAGPSLILIAITIVLLLGSTRDPSLYLDGLTYKGQGLRYMDEDRLAFRLTLSSRTAVMIWITLMPIFLAVGQRRAPRLIANFSEYRLTGLSVGEILRGIAGPWPIGIFLGGLTCFNVCYVPEEFISGGGAYRLFLPFPDICGFAAMSGAILFSILASGAWAFVRNAVSYCLLLAIVGLMTSPIYLFLMYCVLDQLGLLPFLPRIYAHHLWIQIVEIISLPFRLVLVFWLWRKAERRFESGGF